MAVARQAEDNKMAGLGKVLITFYAILAIAATARSVYQLFAKFGEAPLAYSLSALSGVVYVVATFALARRGDTWRKVAWITLGFELFGVLLVGALSVFVPVLFAHPSVWSWFGMGYGFIPLVLPLLGMLWLRKSGA